MTRDPSNERMDVFSLFSVLDLGQTHPRRTSTVSDGRESERERDLDNDISSGGYSRESRRSCRDGSLRERERERGTM